MNTYNEFANSVKNGGALKVGDILELPQGLSQSIKTYHGMKTYTLSITVQVQITHLDYRWYSVTPLVSKNAFKLNTDGFLTLYKKHNFDCVIQTENGIADDWHDFKISSNH